MSRKGEKIRVLVTIPRSLYKKVSRVEDEEMLKSFAECVFNQLDRNLNEEELSELIVDIDGCITSWGSPRFTETVLNNANRLKIIGHAAGSVKPYVTDAVFKKGIVVVNAASTIAKPVAEFTLAMILNCLRGIPKYVEAMRRRSWNYKDQKSFSTYDLRGKTIGIIGFGAVARELVKLLKPFETSLIIYDPYLEPSQAAAWGAKKVDLTELLACSDVVTLHAASTTETYHMLGEKEFRLMKPTSYLINTSRGALIDENALIKALKEKRIAGAALDVFEQEPLEYSSPLYDLENVFLTPHVAGGSDESMKRLFGTVVEDFKRFFSGEKLVNTVPYEKLKILA
ncbi:MAG: hydroxyacid dehydrogenase [Crenarchaeota archaeon]|nr:hydroxyacid dehydrogenase [Thermoproteota archaeon]